MTRFGRFGRVDPANPEAAAVCDRGGEVVRHRDLRPEMHWVGGKLIPNGLMVCERHIDRPNPQDGARRPSYRDPQPIRNPRPEPYLPPGTPGTELRFLATDAHGNGLLDEQGRALLRAAPALYAVEPGAITDADGAPLFDGGDVPLIREEFPE